MRIVKISGERITEETNEFEYIENSNYVNDLTSDDWDETWKLEKLKRHFLKKGVSDRT